MKHKSWPITTMLAASHLAYAQSDISKLPHEKIYYSRAIPAAVLKQMPHSGKSRFFGISKLKLKGKQVMLHVYDLAPTDFSAHRDSYGVKDYAPDEGKFQAVPLSVSYYGIQQVGFDLFAPAQTKHGRGLRRINVGSFNYVRFVNNQYPSANDETIGADLMWLDPKTKHIPIIKIDIRANGVEGPVGVEMLLVFPHGLTSKAIAEGFGYGADNSSEGNSWGSSFTIGNNKGLLSVQSNHSTMGSSTDTLLEWNGSYFMPVKSSTRTWIP